MCVNVCACVCVPVCASIACVCVYTSDIGTNACYDYIHILHSLVYSMKCTISNVITYSYYALWIPPHLNFFCVKK